MNRIATVAVASLASLAATALSHAGTYSGFWTSPGLARIITSANQTSTGATNATSYLAVERCSGVMEYPAWVVGPAAVCTATTPDYKIVMEVLSATQTRVTIQALSGACSIRSIAFGTPNSQCGFDLTQPSPGTSGSLTGANPVAVTGSLIGVWDAKIRLDNIVKFPTIPPAGDLYSRMTIFFSSCFDGDDKAQFLVDTDKIS